MNKHPLDPSYAKIRRAEAHIKDLNTELRAFLGSSPYRLVSNLNNDGTEEVWSIAVHPIPEKIECVAADAVHNLRTPLDKMLAAGFRLQAVHLAGAEIQRLKFPASNSLNELRVVLTNLEKHLTQPVVEFLRKTEPYPGGRGQIFSAINQLDNRDKHRSLLEPIKPSFSTHEMRSVAVSDGFLLRLGSKRGRHLRQRDPNRNGDLIQEDPDLKPIFRLALPTMNDTYLEFSSPHDDMEVFTVTAGSKVKADIKPTLNVAFSEAGPFEGKPVIQALETMREAVEIVLDTFRAKFF